MSHVFHHAAVCVHESAGDDEDREDLEEIRERRGVLERMRRVGIEEAAPIRAELLDRFLAGDGSHREHLLRSLERRYRDVRVEVLDHSLLHEHEGEQHAHRQEQIERSTREIDPEVADPPRGSARDATRERNCGGHPRGRGREVVEGELRHLREVRHHRLAAVRLPVRVGGEGRCCLECLPIGNRPATSRVQWQDVLKPERNVGHEHRDCAEDQHRCCITSPVLILLGVDAADPIDHALDGSEPSERAVVDFEDVDAHWLRDREENRGIEEDLEPAIGCHSQNRSGRSSV